MRLVLLLASLASCARLLGLEEITVGSNGDAGTRHDGTPASDGSAAAACSVFNSAAVLALDPLLQDPSNLSIHDDGKHGVVEAQYQSDGDVRPRPLVLSNSVWLDDTARDQFQTTLQLYTPIIDPTDPNADTMYIATPGNSGVPPLGDVEWTYTGSMWTEGPTLDSGFSPSIIPTGFGKVGSASAIVEVVESSSSNALQLLVDGGSSWVVETTPMATINAMFSSLASGTLTYDGLTLVYVVTTESTTATLYASTRHDVTSVFPIGAQVTLPASLQGSDVVEPWLIEGSCTQMVVRSVNVDAGVSTFYLLTP